MTTETLTLTDFLLARVGEDEETARAAAFQTFRWQAADDCVREDISTGFHAVADVYDDREVAAHIARHDPERVLAECATKRRILAQHRPKRAGAIVAKPGESVEQLKARWAVVVEKDVPAECPTCVFAQNSPCPTLRLLAEPYADHPDYREEWRA